MPEPTKKESKEEYIAKFMSSEEAKKSHPDEKQRLAVANSKWKEHSKAKETTAMFEVVKIKESDDGKVYTFVGANTLPDRARGKSKDGTSVDGEILSKKVLDKVASYINNPKEMGGKYGSYRTVSLFHDRVYSGDMRLEEAGFVIPNTATVKEIDGSPGNYELLVDVEVNEYYKPEMYPDYTPDKIHYKIEKGALGLSIEYDNPADKERVIEVGSKKYNYVMDTDDFRGFGFARPNLIGNTRAVRVKEMLIAEELNLAEIKNNERIKMDEVKIKEMELALSAAQAKIKELEEAQAEAEKAGENKKVEELKEQVEEQESKVKEMKLQMDNNMVKMKEALTDLFASMKHQSPVKTKEDESVAKIKEIYENVTGGDFVKFKEDTNNYLNANGTKIKEMMATDGQGFNFEKWQTVEVKCKGSRMVVVPSAKTKDILSSGDMNEATYYQTNAMFADRYVAGITETFLKEDNLMKAINKEQHVGGNDKYQWRIWTEYTTVTGDNTLAVDPDVTSVTRTVRDFIKLETPIREYRDGVEVTDFTQAHSMAAVGDLLGIQLQRAAEAVTESMNSDLFKSKCDSTSAWVGFNGLISFADSSTHTTIYGRVRSAANRLLDSTLANTYVTTAEDISRNVLRAGYNKVLAHGSSPSEIACIMHPIQFQRLLDSEDAYERHVIMGPAPARFGFDISAVPFLDGILPIIRDYRCESSAAAADMFAIVDMSVSKGLNLVVSKPLGARGLAKVGTSESAYVSFWGQTVYKSPRNIFVHTGLTAI